MNKPKQEVPVRLCDTCELPLEKKDHESMPRYMKKKTHSGLCARTYLKKNKLGFYGNNFDPFDYNYEPVSVKW
jgi:hypothetical protein